MLKVENLSFSYDGKVQILKDISFDLNPGEVLGLMAPSGYGKSTLGKLMAGYIKAPRGSVTVDGKDINDLRGFLPVQMVHQAPEKKVDIRWKVEKTMLDSITQAQICHLLIHFAKKHKLGILFISHNKDLVEVVSDRIIELKDINKIEKE